MATKISLILIAGLFTLLCVSGVRSQETVKFFFDNQCSKTLWLSASPSDGDLSQGIGAGDLEVFYMDDPWKGSLWVRTNCTTDFYGVTTCDTGDCGSKTRTCQGPPPTYPVTLLNFDVNQGVVTYEVSLVHGHNEIPMRIQPDGGTLVGGGSGACPMVDCVGDISIICPPALAAWNKNREYVGCNSACDATKYCGSNSYTKLFKGKCSLARTFVGDAFPPLYDCKGANREKTWVEPIYPLLGSTAY